MYGIGGPEVLVILMVLAITVVGLGFWIYALVDCVKYEPPAGNDRIVWILVIALAGWIGALVYWLVRRPQRIAQLGR